MPRAAKLAEHGSWPVSGGWLEQTDSCVSLVTAYWDEVATVKRTEDPPQK